MVQNKIKGTVKPEKLELNEAVQEAIKSTSGEIFNELEVEAFLRRIHGNASDRVLVKNKKFLDEAKRCIVKSV